LAQLLEQTLQSKLHANQPQKTRTKIELLEQDQPQQVQAKQQAKQVKLAYPVLS
jgi:hypothetical protein